VRPAPALRELGDAPAAIDDPFRLAAGLSYVLLKETDPARLRDRVVTDTRRLLYADAARLLEPDERGDLTLTCEATCGQELPQSALVLERALALRAVDAGKSLISNHYRLYPELRGIADSATADGVLTHAMLIRAYGQSHGVVVVHWLGRERPSYESRSGAYVFWDNVGLAVATSNERRRLEAEREELERLALHDELTGLPNQHLLIRALQRRLTSGEPATLLHVDFDGMREANNALGYEGGGDFLIRTVGSALPTLLRPGELAARLHRAGDEFACLLQAGADGGARAAELEQSLDTLPLPDSHTSLYGGASVGHARSTTEDTPATLIARAAASMRSRKHQRHRSSSAD
jgi:diguanylate cyclase (GGDEF)-like protein